MDAIKIFSDYLRKKELKTTSERLTILQIILHMDKHFDADNLLLQIKHQNKKISRATIYRTLDLLVDCGLVNKINFGSNSYRYEPNLEVGVHDHFLCIECGKIIEFYDEELELIHKRLNEKYKLKILDYTHQIYGKCSDCQKIK